MSAELRIWWFARHDETTWSIGEGDYEIALGIPDADTARLMRGAPRLRAALEAITPAMPPADAPCHAGIVPQAECAYCRRIAAAHAILQETAR